MEKVDYSENNLPFANLRIDQISSMDSSAVETHLTHVYKAVGKTIPSSPSNTVANTSVVNTLSDRINILGYLIHISSSAEVRHFVSGVPLTFVSSFLLSCCIGLILLFSLVCFLSLSVFFPRLLMLS
jgi:hypothetical protein